MDVHGNTVTLERTFDLSSIKAIIYHPALKDIIFSDDQPINLDEEYLKKTIALDGVYYLLARKNGHPAGVLILHKYGEGHEEGVWQLHVNMLPKNRADTADMGMALAEKWAVEHLDAKKFTAVIPVLYQNVIGYVLRNNWNFKGVSDETFIKKNKKYTEYVFEKELK